MTGLVYLAIIALWVMFLIPWLGRHRDEQNGRKTANRYHRAMDTLARAGHTIRHPRDHDDELTELEADELQAMEVANAPSYAVPNLADTWHSFLAVVKPDGGRRSSAAKRRRRVLAVLTVALLGAVGGALAGVVPGVVVVGMVILLVGYLTLLVRQASRSAVSSDRQRTGSAQADRFREETRRAQAQARGLLAPEQSATGATEGWDAVPATLPTYVSKPKASKVPRIVDLTSPSRAWNGAAMVQRAQQERQRAQAAEAAARQFEREISVVERDPVQEVAELANPEQPTYSRSTYRRAANG